MVASPELLIHASYKRFGPYFFITLRARATRNWKTGNHTTASYKTPNKIPLPKKKRKREELPSGRVGLLMMHFTSSVPLLTVCQLTDNFCAHILGRYAESALRYSVRLPQKLHCGPNTLLDNLKATCRYSNINMSFREQIICQNLTKIASITMVKKYMHHTSVTCY